jgi:hypothetical protein
MVTLKAGGLFGLTVSTLNVWLFNDFFFFFTKKKKKKG